MPGKKWPFNQILRWFLFPALLAAPGAAQERDSGPLLSTGRPNPDAVAVVIGIAHYHNADMPMVEFADQDATDIEELLSHRFGFPSSRVYVRKDEFASLASLKPLIRQELATLVKPGKTDLFFYYSGHGVPNLDSHEAYLLPWDYDPRYRPDRDRAYSLKDLYEDLSRLNARTTTVVLDACFSGLSEGGTVLKDLSSAYVAVEMPEGALPSGLVITAGGANEVASWYRERQHGLLTFYLLRALQGEADPEGKGRVTVEGLRRYLQDKVSARAEQLHQRKQIPQVISSIGETRLVAHLANPPDLGSDSVDAPGFSANTTVQPAPAAPISLTAPNAEPRSPAGAGIRIDVATGLMWAIQETESNVTWKQAESYCSNFRGEGHSGWRLPTIAEMSQVRIGPVFNDLHVAGTFWSDTRDKSPNQAATSQPIGDWPIDLIRLAHAKASAGTWYFTMNFENGWQGSNISTDLSYSDVICVRSVHR